MRRRRLHASLDNDWVKVDSLLDEAALPDVASHAGAVDTMGLADFFQALSIHQFSSLGG